ncbi:MAG: hypothetical protein IKH43_07920 [Bacteroidaceae bacterium]|nr:hypothetical protein [Bacteroidaceae bacterium]
MDDTALNIDTNPNGMQTEEQFSVIQKQLQEDDDGTATVPIDSDALIQYFINDSKKVLEATDEKMSGVLAFIANRLEETHHKKLKPLYRSLITFAYKQYQQSRTIAMLKQEMTSFIGGHQQGIIVQREQVNYANGKLANMVILMEDVNAMEEPVEKIDFEYEGNSVFVWNGTRDRIFRYWYLHRDRHVALDYSNRMIAKEMNAELGVTVDYAAKIISQINRWFVNPTNMSWLSGDYIMRTQMLFSYRGYSYLQLNYCHQPPSRQQIITLGQQLQVNTRQQEEE